MRLCHLLLDQMHTDHIKQSIKPNGALIWSYNQKAQSLVALPSRLGDSSNAYPGFAAKRSTVSWPSSSTSSAMQPPGLQAGECVSLHNLRAAPEKPTHGTVKTVICHHGKYAFCVSCIQQNTLRFKSSDHIEYIWDII